MPRIVPPSVQFIDADEYQGEQAEKLTFKIIVLEYLKRIGFYCSCELRGGYKAFIETKTGVKETYVEDTRERLCNSIEFLYNLLAPHFDEKMKNHARKFLKIRQIYRTNFIKESTPKEKVVLGDVFYTEQSDRILLETFKQKKLQLYILLFRHLNKFLARKRYMESTPYEEVI